MASQVDDLDPRGADGLLSVRELSVGRRLVIVASGEIDTASVGVLLDALARAMESGAADVWLDLSDVAFMDSTGLDAALAAGRELDGLSRQFAVICPDGPVRRVFEIAGVTHALAIFPDRAAVQAAR